MTEGQSKLRELHFLLKHALGNIPLERRKDRIGLSLPTKEYSFIESDDEPLNTWDYYLDYLPKYAELTGLVTKHPDYERMQDILQWFADNEDSLRDTGFDKEEISKHPELKPRKPAVNKTDLSNIAKTIIAARGPTGTTDDDDELYGPGGILNFDKSKEDDDILV